MISPTFPFDVPGWQGSKRVQRMDAPARACYLEMLICQWDTGSAPPTPEACAEQLSFPLEVWQHAWPQLVHCFQSFKPSRKRKAGLVNTKLDRIRRNRADYIRAMRELGSKGGNARQQKQLLTTARQADANRALSDGQASIDLDLNRKIKDQRSAPAVRYSRIGFPQPPSADGNKKVITRIAFLILDADPGVPPGEHVDRVKDVCAMAKIDYGRDQRVDQDVVVKMVESVRAQRGVL